jgi:hypothetical protein
MVSASKEKVVEKKNSEKATEMQVSNKNEINNNEEEVLLVICAGPNSEPKFESNVENEEANIDSKVEPLDNKSIEVCIIQNELRLVKAELEEQNEQNKKLRSILERQALGLPSKEAFEKIALLEEAVKEQKEKAAELALQLEAEKARVSELTDKLEAFAVEEPVLIACAVTLKGPELEIVTSVSEVIATIQEVKVGGEAQSSYKNNDYNYGNYSNNYTSNYSEQPSTLATNNYISSSNNINYGATSDNSYGGSNYYYTQPGYASGNSLVSASSNTTNKSPISYSDSIKTTNNYTSSTSNNNNYNSNSNYSSNYIGYSDSANGNLVLCESSNPNSSVKTVSNADYGKTVYNDTYSGSTNYPPVTYNSRTTQVLRTEDFSKRISQETDDIVAKVLKESNLTFGNIKTNGLRSQQLQYFSGTSLVNSCAKASSSSSTNKSLYASTYYAVEEKSNASETILKNKSIYEALNTN